MLDVPAIEIDRAYEADPPDWLSRTISAGVIGHPCEAFLAYTLRSFPEVPVPPRVKRVFKVGHVIERLVIEDLRKAGYNVWDKDGLTGKQFTYLAYGGHVKAKADGLIEMRDGKTRLLEIKSMNNANWSKFAKFGVRVSHPRYYWQAQLEMGLACIHELLLVAYNKDTSSYHSEIVKFDAFDYAAANVKIETVLGNRARKVATSEADWRCKECSKRDVCWGGRLPEPACHNCAHAVPNLSGGWHCGKHNREATAVCGEYEVYRPLPRE